MLPSCTHHKQIHLSRVQQMITSHLPQELVDMIIDHLFNDRKTLARCALVSRHWVDTAYMHLCAKISPLDSPSRIPSLTTFALTLPSLSHIQQYTRHLGLYSPPKSRTKVNISIEALSSVLENLPHLDILTCGDVELVLQPRKTYSSSRHVKTPLRVPHVRFFNTHFTSHEATTSALHNLLSRLEGTQTLSLTHITFGLNDLSLFIPARTRASLQKLVTVDIATHLADRLIILRNTLDLPGIISFGTSLSSAENIELVGSFLRDSLRHISVLELNLQNYANESTSLFISDRHE